MPSKKRTRIENAQKTVTKEHLSGARLEEWLTDWRRSTSLQTHTYRRAGDISPHQSVVWVCVEGGTHAAGVTTHTGTLCVCVTESCGSVSRMLWCVWVNRALDHCCTAYSVTGGDMQKTPPQTCKTPPTHHLHQKHTLYRNTDASVNAWQSRCTYSLGALVEMPLF